MKASIAVAERIRAQIAQGALLPGDPLPVADDLTVQMGCSKPVVREALRILETEGLVEIRRGVGGGPRVRHPSVVDAAKAVGLHLQIGDVRVLDVWEARDRIVASAVERLAGGASPVAVRDLESGVDDLAASLGDLWGFNRRMLDLGEAAVRAAGNATEALLVGALRHVVEVEIDAATRQVSNRVGREIAIREGEVITRAWRRTLSHVRAGRPRAARRTYEEQADALRALVGARIPALTVGDAATLHA